MAVFAGAVAMGCLPGLTGSDECQAGTERCSNGSVELCQKPCSEFGCGNQWANGPRCSADQICVEIDANNAECALSSEPDPQCGNSRGYCDGSVAVDCGGGGYSIDREDCGDRICVLTTYFPVCALSPEEDPRCAGNGGYCDGDTAVLCESDHVTARQACRHSSGVGVGDSGAGACVYERPSRNSAPTCVDEPTDASDPARSSR
jgi:hypothetical protein